MGTDKLVSIFRIFMIISIAVLLAGCGGGGGEDNPSNSYSITGSVSGVIQQGVTITLSGASSASVTTNAGGNYTLSGLIDGSSYTVTPSKPGYSFSPPSINIIIDGANSTANNFIASSSGTAYSFADLNGTWYGAGILTPAQNSSNAANFGYDVDSMVISNGAATITPVSSSDSSGTDTATLSIASDGTVSSGDADSFLFMNAGKDVLCSLWRSTVSGSQEFGLDVKRGASYTLSDLNGTWYGVGISTPQKVKPVPDSFDYEASQMVINSGVATISLISSSESGETVTLSITSDGTISAGDPNSFLSMNAGKDVMYGFWLDPDTKGQGMEIWVKKGATYTATDLNGTWHGIGIMTPTSGNTTVSTSYFGYFVDHLVASNGSGLATPISTDLDFNASASSITISSNGEINKGESGNYSFMNAGKNVICTLYRYPGADSQAIQLYVKQ
jgi:hypothetical protein